MRRAIALAREGDRRPGANPIGCVIVLDGEIVGEGYNEVDVRYDPTAHAETVAMRRAGETLWQSEFRGVTLYSTLQPCGMCTMASIWAKIGRIVYGAERDQVHPMYFENRHLGTMDFVPRRVPRRSLGERWAARRRVRDALYRPERGGAEGRAVQPVSGARREAKLVINKGIFAKDFPVVCVGGSAGGLDAYTRLLRHLPADMGVAIVIVNHLRTVATLLSRDSSALHEDAG